MATPLIISRPRLRLRKPRLTTADQVIIRGVEFFMASGAKNQLPLVNVLGALTLSDMDQWVGGIWDGKGSFFFDGFIAGGHL